jgi:nucleoside-diphosphate-sugar epimerase
VSNNLWFIYLLNYLVKSTNKFFLKIMKKILITGIKGCIGPVLKKNLSRTYDITGFDIPENDVSDFKKMKELIVGYDAIIHLAMDPKVGFMDENFNKDDFTMVYNVYQIAKENKIPRVIMFSSIHADDYMDWDGKILKTVDTIPWPDSPYGAYKIYMEGLGRYYSKKGVEVICIRLGGVTPDDRIDINENGFEKVYLSHKDLLSMVKTCVEIDKVPNNYALFYAISNNKGRIHDTTNSIGWKPVI